MHGHGLRRNRRLSCGSAGRAVNVWRTSRERLRGGTRAASIGSWLAMEGLLQRHAGGLWERCGLRSAKRFREALPPVGRYDGSHRASNDRPQLSAERSGVTAACSASRASEADKRAWRRALRPKPCRLARHAELRWRVAQKLVLQWSPEQISGWLKRQFPAAPGMQVSHETIYRSLFIQTRGVLKK